MNCHGIYLAGSACGRCERCESELMALIDLLVSCHRKKCKYNKVKCTVHGSQYKPCPYEVAKSILDLR